jgi:hypothetical protein
MGPSASKKPGAKERRGFQRSRLIMGFVLHVGWNYSVQKFAAIPIAHNQQAKIAQQFWSESTFFNPNPSRVQCQFKTP